MKTSSTLFTLGCLFLLFPMVVFCQIPAGYYYPADGKKQKELKTSLHQIVKEASMFSYGSGEKATWQGFYHTDRKGDNQVYDMYSDIVRSFNGYGSVSGMHIEHSLPKSWWGSIQNNAYKDLFHLYPSDGPTNSSKGNNPLGIVTGTPVRDNGVSKLGKNGFGSEYTGNCFEPADEYKGDFARSYFYMATAYEDFAPLWVSPMMDNNTYPVWRAWARDLLLQWHRQDPVSAKERARIEQVYQIQGNRNPFIDYPELVEYIWGQDTLSVYHFPQEKDPFLVSPIKGTKVDFGVTYQNQKKKVAIFVKGINVSAPLSIYLKQASDQLSLSKTELTPLQWSTGYTLEIEFSATEAKEMNDTLIFHSSDLQDTLSVPVAGYVSTSFMILPSTESTPVSALMRWVEVPGAVQYSIDVFQNDTVAGDLIIASYIEGSSYNKAIEIYNGTGKPVDLSSYYFKKQSNGEGPFVGKEPLSGWLANGKSYLVVSSQCTNADLKSKADKLSLPAQEDLIFNFNGDDPVGLFKDGVMIDVVGVVNGGTALYWGQDITLIRKPFVTHPYTLYNRQEWSQKAKDDWSHLGSVHPMELAFSVTPVIENKTVNPSSSLWIEGLHPGTTYTARMKCYTDRTIVSTNSIHLVTSELEVPQMFDPTDVTDVSFVANWEEVPYATSYVTDLYTVQQTGTDHLYFDFNSVGSNGQPLPQGFVSTVSGNYTSAASSGASPNALSFKNNEEYLITPALPQTAIELSFVYRYPSSATGSFFVLEKQSQGEFVAFDTIMYQNTTKASKQYQFSADEDISCFRFTYYKSSGNFAFDDLDIRYLMADTIFIAKEVESTLPEYKFTALTRSTDYYYRTAAQLLSTRSDYSHGVKVRTLDQPPLSEEAITVSPFEVYNSGSSVVIDNLEGGEILSLYTMEGSLRQKIENREEKKVFISLPIKKGLYLLSIFQKGILYHHKIIIY